MDESVMWLLFHHQHYAHHPCHYYSYKQDTTTTTGVVNTRRRSRSSSMGRTLTGTIIMLFWVVVFLCHPSTTFLVRQVHAVTVRYRQGRLLMAHAAIQEASSSSSSLAAVTTSTVPNDTTNTTTLWWHDDDDSNNLDTAASIVIYNISVTQARRYCQEHLDCVSFGFESSSSSSSSTSSTRFPSSVIRAVYFYPFADWHVVTKTTTVKTIDGQASSSSSSSFHSAFVPDDAWHLYVNTTREMQIIPREMNVIVQSLDSLQTGPCRTTSTTASIIAKVEQVDDIDSSSSSSSLSKQQQQQQQPSLRTSRHRSSSSGTSIGSTQDATARQQQEQYTVLLLQEQLRLEQECIQPKLDLMNAIYPIVYVSNHHQFVATVAPYLIPKLLQLAYNNSTTSTTTSFQQQDKEEQTPQQEHVDVRTAAITNLMVIADSRETAPLLVQAGTFHVMQQIIKQELVVQQQQQQEQQGSSSSSSWDGLPILALDVISNICLHQTANNAQLKQQGAMQFLHQIAHDEKGTFPALQALLALLHMGGGSSGGDGGGGGGDDDASDSGSNNNNSRRVDDDTSHFVLPQSTVVELVHLLQSSIDGDIVYGILWDLIPGPLSAIQFLIQHEQYWTTTTSLLDSSSSSTIVDDLLNAGLIEQLVRILEASCLVAAHVHASLEILHSLAQVSPHRAPREMIALVAANSIRLVQERLQEYQAPARLAMELQMVVAHHDFVGASSLSSSALSEEL
jgi:hypothetical protein